MTENRKPLSGAEFWEIKHKIDDEVARLGWSKDYCKRYIEYHYGAHSRLYMTDSQLHHFLSTLQKLKSSKSTQKLLKRKSKSKRR